MERVATGEMSGGKSISDMLKEGGFKKTKTPSPQVSKE